MVIPPKSRGVAGISRTTHKRFTLWLINDDVTKRGKIRQIHKLCRVCGLLMQGHHQLNPSMRHGALWRRVRSIARACLGATPSRCTGRAGKASVSSTLDNEQAECSRTPFPRSLRCLSAVKCVGMYVNRTCRQKDDPRQWALSCSTLAW